MQFLSYLINGISLGSVYALIALGYTMVYGIAKMLNFAHGDVIMIGSYVVFFAFGSAGMNPVLAIVLSMVVCTVLGVTIERVAYRPLREAPSLAVLITAIGVSYLCSRWPSWLGRPTPRALSLLSRAQAHQSVRRAADHLGRDRRDHHCLHCHHGRADLVRQ